MMEDYDTPVIGDCNDCEAHYESMGEVAPCETCKIISHCDQCDHWDMCVGCPYTGERKC